MAIVPIIIYRDRKSDKEIHEEMEREERWRKAVEEDEKRRREREERARLEKIRLKNERERAIQKEIDSDEMNNPWEFRVLPGGWNLFGQLSIEPIPWDGTEEEYDNLINSKE